MEFYGFKGLINRDIRMATRRCSPRAVPNFVGPSCSLTGLAAMDFVHGKVRVSGILGVGCQDAQCGVQEKEGGPGGGGGG